MICLVDCNAPHEEIRNVFLGDSSDVQNTDARCEGFKSTFGALFFIASGGISDTRVDWLRCVDYVFPIHGDQHLCITIACSHHHSDSGIRGVAKELVHFAGYRVDIMIYTNCQFYTRQSWR